MREEGGALHGITEGGVLVLRVRVWLRSDTHGGAALRREVTSLASK